jgi:hypothetical protein
MVMIQNAPMWSIGSWRFHADRIPSIYNHEGYAPITTPHSIHEREIEAISWLGGTAMLLGRRQSN